MRGTGESSSEYQRPGTRSHIAAAAAALVASAALHVVLVATINRIPGLVNLPATPLPRYKPIEMADVRMSPPPMEEKLETIPLDEPPSDIPFQSVATDAIQDITPPESVKLPLPAVEANLIPETLPAMSPEVTPVIRQEVMAIQDKAIPDEVSALPRRWIEKDIPKIDQAPDIQLPMDVLPDGGDADIPRPQPALFTEYPEAGTPDWSVMMSHQLLSNPGGASAIRAGSPAGRNRGGLDERPEDISSLNAIDDLLQIRVLGYREPAGTNLYLAIHIEPVNGGILKPLPRDILFIQDSSESMTPWKLDECRRGLKRWLDFMNPGDRFEVMGFRETTYGCFGDWTEFNPENKAKALAFIDSMRAAGDTDVYASLQSALERRIDNQRTPMLILISDGRPTVGVIGSSEIIEGITRFNRGRTAMFAVGGGKKVNSFFLDLISYRNRGDAVVAKGEDEIPSVMEAWARQLRRPVLTDLSCTFARIDPSDIYPKQLSHLFLDRPLVIHGRFPADAQQIVFQVVGRSVDQWHDMVFTIDRDQIPTADPGIREQWAWQKVYHMIGDYLGDPSEERLESIRAFADTYRLLVPYGFSRALPRTGER